MSKFQPLIDFGSGMSFGVAQIIPGVSAGTIAIILGFYDRLIEAMNNITKDFRKQIRFIIPFAIGIVVGILALSSLISFLLERFSFPTMLFFIGLIAGTLPMFNRKVQDSKGELGKWSIVLIIIPAMVVMALAIIRNLNYNATAIDPAETVANINVAFMLYLFAVGVVAAAALIIPGLSGSFILLLAGVFPLATFSVSSIIMLLTDPTNFDLMLDIIKVLGPLGVGVLVGMFSTARLIGGLFKRHAPVIYRIIYGLMIGSIFALIVEPMVLQSDSSIPILLLGVVTAAVGCVLSFRLSERTSI